MRLAMPTLFVAALLAPLAAAADRVVDVEAGTNADGSMYLRPDRVEAALDDNVTIRVKNVDAIFHDVAILSYGRRDIEIEVPPHATEQRHFVADTLGTFRMVCEVNGHKQKGMQGNFTVSHVDARTKGLPDVGLPALAGILVAAAVVLRRR